MKKILLSAIALFLTALGAVAQCDAPTDVQASATWQKAKVSWRSPLLNDPMTLDYGVPIIGNVGVGIQQYNMGVRYPADSMQRFAGKQLRSISFFPNASIDYTLNIYSGGYMIGDTVYSGGTLVHTQLISSADIAVGQVNEIMLSSQLTVTGSEELLVSFQVAPTSSVYPFGFGYTNAVDGYTNLGIFDSTAVWDTWNILENPTPGLFLQCHFIDPCSITGFNLFRDNVLLNTNPINGHFYIDTSVVSGQQHCYTVQSICGTTTSDASPYCLTIPAQPICPSPMVGNGTQEVNYLPVGSYYRYSYSQQIYTAAEIGAHTGTIASITFQYFYNTPYTWNNVTIYMANVSDSVFSNSSAWIPTDELTEVFNGSIYCSNADSNNVTVDLDQYFEWDGSSNVVVAFLNGHGTYDGSSSRFYAHATNGYRAMYTQRDGSTPYDINATLPSGNLRNYRNNMKFCFGPELSCYRPVHVQLSNITSSGATLTWNRHSESDNSWEVVVVPSGYAVSSGTPMTVSDTTYTFTTLQDNTDYDVYVRTVCSGTEQSSWVKKSFRTRCVAHSTIPYTENFSGYGTGGASTFPPCWSRMTNYASTQYPYINSNYQLYLYSYDDYYSLAASQALDLSNYAENTLAFSFEIAKSSTNYGRLDVGIMTDPADLNTLTVLKSFYPSDIDEINVFQQEYITLAQAYTQPVYLAFYAPSGVAVSNYVLVKNVKVDYVPTCLAPSNLTVSDVTGTAATLSWTEALYGAQGYSLEYGETGQQMTTVPVQDNSYMLTGLTQGTQYQVNLYSNCAEGTADTLTAQFTTLSFVECTQADTVANEITGTSTSTSYLIPVNNYYNYTYTQQIFTADEIDSTHTPNVLTGIAFEYSYSSPMTDKDNVQIYLAHRTRSTFSGTNDWTPISEATLVYEGPFNCTQGWNTFEFDNYFSYNGTDNLVLIVNDNSGDYNGQSYAFNTHSVSGNRTLAARRDNSNYDPANPGSGSYESSQNDVKFFKCLQVVPQSCPVPMVYVSGEESDAITVEWVSNGSESSWNLEYRAAGETAWTSMGTVSASPATISNLNTDIDYEVRLQALCAAGDSSLWVYATAHTPCLAVDLPLTENFDSVATGIPGCWTSLYNTSSATPTVSTSSAYSGSKSLYFNCSSSSQYAYFISPRLSDNIAMNNLQIMFAARKTSSSYFIQVGIMSDPADPSTFVSVGQFSPSAEYTWQECEMMSTNYTGNGRYVAFRIPAWYSNSIYLDDIYVGTIPECMHVDNIAASEITATGATITWTPGGSETSWNYILGPAGTVDTETDPSVSVSESSVMLDQLTPNTPYDIYVQAACSGSEQSPWKRYTFRTGCAALTAVPYTENFDSYQGATNTSSGNVSPSCWSHVNYSATNDAYPLVLSNSNAYSGSNSLYFYTYTTSYSDYSDLFAIMPEIDTLQLPINTLQLTFMAKPQYSSYPFNIQVGVMSNPADTSTFVHVATINAMSSTYSYQEVNFNNYPGGGQYIAFKVLKPASFYSYNAGYIDDVELKLMPQCSPVRDIEVSDVTGSSARFSWTAGSIGTVSGYTLEYAIDDNSDNWIVASNNIQGTSYLLGGLEQVTSYKVRVKTNCDDSESAYETAEFTTVCLAGTSVEIGTGTSTTGYFPSYSNYNYSYTQQIFLSTEMNGASTFRSVSFDVSTLGMANRNLQIYLMSTTESAPSNWLSASTAQLVYSGPVTFTEGWNTLDFITPFQYNGTDNLALIVVDVTGSYSSVNYFKCHTGHSGCSRYVYNDYTTYSISSTPSSSGYSSTNRNNIRFGGDCDSTVTCFVPNMYVSAVGETTADIAWVAGYQETAWEMDYTVQGDSTWTSVSNPTGFSVQLTGLTSNTLYQVRMRSVCGAGDESQYVYASFRTDCGILSIPYTEDFNSYSGAISSGSTTPSGYPNCEMPSCWTILNLSQTSSSYPQAFISNYSSYASSGNCFFVRSSSATPLYAILPTFNVDINTLQMTFKYRNESTSSSNGTLEVGYVTSLTDPSTFVSLYACPLTTTITEVEQVFSSVPALGAGNSFIAFKVTPGSSSNMYLGLDDIYVEAIPTCPRPATLVVSNVTSSSVDLSWTETGTATAWNIEYGPQGFTQGTGTTVAATTNPFTLTGLSVAAYDFYVQADCGSGESSGWRGPVSATPGSYFMPTSGSTTITTCDGIIYDDGGATGEYSSYCDATLVINPATPGNMVQVEGIGNYSFESGFDYLIIYDGTDDTGTQLFSTQSSSSGTIPVCTSTTGSITLYLHSDSGVEYDGFALQVSCTTGGDPDPGPTPPDPGPTPPEPGVTCDAPTNLTVSDVTFNSANLTWTQTGTPDSWTIYFRKGTDAWTTANTTTPSPYALTDLAPESNYEAYVVAVCGDSVSAPSNTVTFSTLADGIADYVLSQTKLYPNPTSSNVTIVNNNCMIEKVEVYDVYGQTIRIQQVNGNSVVLPAEELAAGMYFVRIITDKGTVVKPFTKR